MNKFTPGPWFIPSTMGSSGGVAHASGYVCFTATPRKVDEARQPGESWLDMRNRTTPERAAIAAEESANACLIAAAPDLLDALRDLLAAASLSAAQGKPFAADSPGIVAARSALAKATGEAP